MLFNLGSGTISEIASEVGRHSLGFRGEGPAFDQWRQSWDMRVNKIVPLPDPEMPPRYLESMREEVATHHPPDSEIVRNLYRPAMMRELGRQMRRRGEDARLPSRFSAQRLLEEQWDRHVTLSDLAREVCLSPAHLCALFLRHVGQPPIDYQATIRVRRAALLLRNFELTVSDVARQVGYDEPGYFSQSLPTTHERLSHRIPRQPPRCDRLEA